MRCCIAGFNGERVDPVSSHCHLGNGYRSYSPVLGRFTAPDSWSPFGVGGINPYAYCAGDPVNRADPSGHFSLGQGLGMALGLVGGFVLGVLTEGMALPVVASLLANMAGDAAIGALSELATEAVDGQQINGRQVGMAALVNAGFSLAGFSVGRARGLYFRAREGMKSVGDFVGGWRYRLQHAGGCIGTLRREPLFTAEKFAYIDNPDNFSHKINEFVITSHDLHVDEPCVNRFTNKFKPDKWTVKAVHREDRNVPYHTSDILAYQYERVSSGKGFSGKMPGRIKIKEVSNPLTLDMTRGRAGEELRDIFVQTPLGKMIGHTVDNFNLRVESVEHTRVAGRVFPDDFIITVGR
jgi:RHS repeat-associated protein